MTMQAWQSGEPGVDHLIRATVARPAPGRGEALVAVEAAALNFSDLLMIDGGYQIHPPRPFVPGQEVAGTVVAAGAGSRLAAGQRVAGKVLWGGFAEYAVVRDDMAFAVPGGIAIERAAALPVAYTTAVVALTESTGVRAGETVLVHAAAGGVGLACVEVAKALGARVIGTAGSAAKRDLARAHGADEVVDYGDEGWVSVVREATAGRGVDVVVDPVGGDVALGSLRVLAYGGRLLIVGFASGAIPSLPANRLLLKRACAVGVYWDHDREEDREVLARATERITALLGDGRIDPHVEARDGLEALPGALAALGRRESRGKLVLRLRPAGRDA